MKTKDIVGEKGWEKVASLLPKDLEQMAREHGALRRARRVPNAQALMRMILAYSVTDFSMKDIGAFAAGMGAVGITAPSFYHRLRHCKEWLSAVLGKLLQQQISAAGEELKLSKAIKLRVADATVVCGPGAKGTEWRVHAGIDPERARFTDADLTDEHGGESFKRFKVNKGDVLLGDRAYSPVKSVAWVHSQGGHVISRLNPHAVRLCEQNREIARVTEWGQRVPKDGVVSYSLVLPVPPDKKGEGTQSAKTRKTKYKAWAIEEASDWIPVRVIGTRVRNGDVLWVLSTLPQEMADDATILKLYRIRWQVELFFKRLKSLLHLDTLPSRRGPTAEVWILGRLIAAALVQQLIEPEPSFSPCERRLSDERI